LTTKIEGSPDCGNNPGKNKHVHSLCDCVIGNLFSDGIKYCHERLKAVVIPQMSMQYGYRIAPRMNRDADRITIPFQDEQDAAEAAEILKEYLPDGLVSKVSGRAVRITLKGDV
jgi:hypothetical protein